MRQVSSRHRFYGTVFVGRPMNSNQLHPTNVYKLQNTITCRDSLFPIKQGWTLKLWSGDYTLYTLLHCAEISTPYGIVEETTVLPVPGIVIFHRSIFELAFRIEWLATIVDFWKANFHTWRGELTQLMYILISYRLSFLIHCFNKTLHSPIRSVCSPLQLFHYCSIPFSFLLLFFRSQNFKSVVIIELEFAFTGFNALASVFRANQLECYFTYVLICLTECMPVKYYIAESGWW